MTDYTIIIEKGDGGYSAYCPDLPGVAAAAATEEETLELMKEAIEFHLDGLRERTFPSHSRLSQPDKFILYQIQILFFPASTYQP